jgi:hypothetical protein
MMPIFADAINFPLVLGFGIIVLVPLIAFEVFSEAFLLSRIWKRSARGLWSFALRANCGSFLAGIPIKIVNTVLYGLLLPEDLPSYFARYPLFVAVGSFLYFLVTVLVEALVAFRWVARERVSIGRGAVWKGITLANIATYVVLAPLHYIATRPTHQVKQFSKDTHWSKHPETRILFADSNGGRLKSIHADGSDEQVIVPFAVRDYLISPDMNLCLFRNPNGDLYLHRRDTGKTNWVCHIEERFQMNSAAFSPTGRYVAFASKNKKSIDVFEPENGKRIHESISETFDSDEPSVAWSRDEQMLYLNGFESKWVVAVTIGSEGHLDSQYVADTNSIRLLPCYGRLSKFGWYGASDWGRSYYEDKCGNLKARTFPGLESGLRIDSEETGPKKTRFYLYVNPGLLHLPRFQFRDVAFLDDCRECVFDTQGYIYILDLERRRVGTLASGERFILMTSRYQKQL